MEKHSPKTRNFGNRCHGPERSGEEVFVRLPVSKAHQKDLRPTNLETAAIKFTKVPNTKTLNVRGGEGVEAAPTEETSAVSSS